MSRKDPSRTSMLRKKYMRAIRKRLNKFKKALNKLVVTDDSFGIGKNKLSSTVVVNKGKDGYAVLLKLLDPNLLQELGNLQASLDTSSLISFEDDAHITLAVGISEKPDVEELEQLVLKRLTDIWTIGVEIFKTPKADVLVVLAVSESLQTIHEIIKEKYSIDQTHEFTPHITLGYYQPDSLSESYLPGFDVIKIPAETLLLQITDPKHIVVNQWENLSDEEKLAAFEEWLQNETGLTILSEDDRFWEDFVDEGFRRGAGRAFEDSNRLVKVIEDAGTFIGRKQNFLSSALNAPESVDKVKLLARSNLSLIKGTTDQMQNRLKQDLLVGLVQGDNPRAIGRRMTQSVNIARKRADRIARTEIIRAHAEGQLEAMEKLGATEISVAVEWTTAGDSRVCPLCSSLEGIVLDIKKAHGLIPRHPNCRCSFAPANVGEDTKDQKRTKESIEEALAGSVMAELPKKAKKTKKNAKRRSNWKGAKISATAAPKSIEELLPLN